MPIYNTVLSKVKSLSLTEQIRLLEELKKLVKPEIEVEGIDEVISAEKIAASEAALQDYLTG